MSAALKREPQRTALDIIVNPPTTSSAKSTPRPETVRVAGPNDERAILDLLILMHEENALAPMSVGRVAEKIQRGTRRQGGIVGVIDGPDGAPVATVGIAMAQWWYSEGWHCDELWSFVHPEHRRSKHAKSLVQFSKWWSEQLGIPLIKDIVSGVRTEEKIKLYARHLQLVGAVFLHRGVSV